MSQIKTWRDEGDDSPSVGLTQLFFKWRRIQII